MGILGGINESVKRWLFKEEIENQEKINYEQIGRQVVGALTEIQKQQQAFEAEMKKINEENHDVRPTYNDIDRYYGYYKGIKEMEKSMTESTWTSVPREVSVISQDQYEAEAKTGGWKYLRESVGLPFPKDQKKEIWKT